MFKFLFIVVFFWMVHNEKLFRSSSVKYLKVVRPQVIYFPYVVRKMKSPCKLSENCSIHCKNQEISISISLIFATENVGPFLVWKLKWGGGGMATLAPPVATPLQTVCFAPSIFCSSNTNRQIGIGGH